VKARKSKRKWSDKDAEPRISSKMEPPGSNWTKAKEKLGKSWGKIPGSPRIRWVP